MSLPGAERPVPSLAWSRSVVVGATFGCWVLCGPVAYLMSGWTGLAAAGAAGATCFLGAFGALLLGHWLRGPQGLLPRVVGGMFVRMAVPLAAALGVALGRSPLADGGFVYYLLVFYLVTLAVEGLGTTGLCIVESSRRTLLCTLCERSIRSRKFAGSNSTFFGS